MPHSDDNPAGPGERTDRAELGQVYPEPILTVVRAELARILADAPLHTRTQDEHRRVLFQAAFRVGQLAGSHRDQLTNPALFYDSACAGLLQAALISGAPPRVAELAIRAGMALGASHPH